MGFVAQADLVPDIQAHRACLERFKAVSRSQSINLRAKEVYRAPREVTGAYTYFFNAEERGTAGSRHYRAQCEARRLGRVTRFVLEPGSWRFEAPGSSRYAAR